MKMDYKRYTMITVLGTNLVIYSQRGIVLTITNPEHVNGEGWGGWGEMTIARTRHQGKLVSADSTNYNESIQVIFNL